VAGFCSTLHRNVVRQQEVKTAQNLKSLISEHNQALIKYSDEIFHGNIQEDLLI
jgi:hypothetical protein